MAWLRRLTPFLPVAGCVLLAVMFVGAASSYSTLDCERSAGFCVVERRSFFTTTQGRLSIESVAQVRYVGDLGKSRDRGQTQLIFTSGREYALATADEDEARLRHAEIEAFFAGRGDDTLLVEDRGSSWFYLLAAASVIAAIVFAIRAARRRPVVPVAAAPRAPSPLGARVRRFFGHREVRVVGLILAVAAVVQITWMLWAGHTQGLLLLECRTRCRFQNAECLPGGKIRMNLDPGDYTIEVWRPQGDGRLWHPHTFTITRGETTTFTCAR